jgi:hypothetical protein
MAYAQTDISFPTVAQNFDTRIVSAKSQNDRSHDRISSILDHSLIALLLLLSRFKIRALLASQSAVVVACK